MAVDLTGLTDEQKNTIAFNKAMVASQSEIQVEQDTARNRMEAIRLAKETLIENSRSLPADQREITASQITAYAESILSFVNNN